MLHFSNLHLHIWLPVPAEFEVAALCFVLDDLNFLATACFGNFGLHFGSGNIRNTYRRGRSIILKEYIVKGNHITLLEGIGKFLYSDRVPCRNFILLTACLYYCEHSK